MSMYVYVTCILPGSRSGEHDFGFESNPPSPDGQCVCVCVGVVRTYVYMCESVCGASTRVDHHSETDHKLVTAHAAMLLCWVHDSEDV